MTDLEEGNNCPLCGGRLEFSPLGECECWSGAGTSGWSPGPCKPCENGGIFCKPCNLFADGIAAELERRALKEPPTATMAAPKKPSPFHRMPPSTAILAACDLWLPGVGGRI